MQYTHIYRIRRITTLGNVTDSASKTDADNDDSKQKDKSPRADTSPHADHSPGASGQPAYVPYALYSKLLERVNMKREKKKKKQSLDFYFSMSFARRYVQY